MSRDVYKRFHCSFVFFELQFHLKKNRTGLILISFICELDMSSYLASHPATFLLH
jgi:hypothetical protein